MSTRRYFAMLSILAALLLGLTGCFNITVPSPGTSTPANSPSSSTATTTTPTSPSGNPPNTSSAQLSVNSFSATPGTIMAGGASTLKWDVSNASEISITPGIGSVGSLTGSIAVMPASTTDFTLTASNGADIITATAEVVVFAGGGLPIVNSFVATPPSIFLGSSTLSWDISNATTIGITPGIGNVGPTGSLSVTPATTTLYILTAANQAGAVQQTVQVTKLKLPIIANPNLPIITKPLLPITPTPITTHIPLPIPSITTPFAVVGLAAQVDPASYAGPCPKTFNFIGAITTNGPGTVTYRWERSDGSIGYVQSATFSAASLQTVTRSWEIGKTFTGWQRLHVLTPNDSLSNQASFTMTCF